MVFMLDNSSKLLSTIKLGLNKDYLATSVKKSGKSQVNHVIMHDFRLFEATRGLGTFKYFLLLQKAVQVTKQLFRT